VPTEDPFHSLWAAAETSAKKEATSACGSGTCRDPSLTAASTSASLAGVSGTAPGTSTSCALEAAVDPLLADATPSPSPRASSSTTKRKASVDEPPHAADAVAYDPKKLRRSTHSKSRATKRAAKV